ncbi:hypothetical protein BJX99DRAFT_124534 [Aspergillus californicus]
MQENFLCSPFFRIPYLIQFFSKLSSPFTLKASTHVRNRSPLFVSCLIAWMWYASQQCYCPELRYGNTLNSRYKQAMIGQNMNIPN